MPLLHKQRQIVKGRSDAPGPSDGRLATGGDDGSCPDHGAPPVIDDFLLMFHLSMSPHSYVTAVCIPSFQACASRRASAANQSADKGANSEFPFACIHSHILEVSYII